MTMSGATSSLIYAREIRDQLRDRRTLFMIAVLPMLLYPLLGMSVFQLSQFLRKSEPQVLVIGTEQVTSDSELPPLLKDGISPTSLFDDPSGERRRLDAGDLRSDSHDAGESDAGRRPRAALPASRGDVRGRSC